MENETRYGIPRSSRPSRKIEAQKNRKTLLPFCLHILVIIVVKLIFSTEGESHFVLCSLKKKKNQINPSQQGIGKKIRHTGFGLHFIIMEHDVNGYISNPQGF